MRSLKCLVLAGSLYLLLASGVGVCLVRSVRANDASDDKMLSAGWRSVSLPYRPICIASDGNTLWVGGADEMIAKSEDDGRTWQVKYQKPNGEVFLKIGLLGDKTIYAAGTGGVILRSDDGGESWKEWNAGTARIIDIVFTDSSHGIKRTESTAEITTDGGLFWSHVSAMKTDDTVRPFSNILGIAAIDSEHYALLLNKTQGENIFLSTQDGGASWTPIHVDNTYARYLFAYDRRYWALGMEIVDRQNRGGYSVPLVLYSSNGLEWIHGAKTPWEFGKCTLQGCVPYDGTIFDSYHEKARYTRFPADGTLTPSWAMSKASLCTVGLALSCAAATPSADLPPRPELPNRPIASYYLSDSLLGCVFCPLNPFPLDKKFLGQVPVTVRLGEQPARQAMMPGLNVTLVMRYRIRPDGTVDNITVQPALRKEIESPLLENIGAWVFEPPRTGDSAPLEEREITVSVRCVAFATNDEATCTVSVPVPNTNTSP